MTLVPVNGFVALIGKAAAVDEDGAKELLRLSTYDYLVDQVESAREQIDADIMTAVAKRTCDARRELMRSYVNKRVEGKDVDGVIQTATHLAAVATTISKADGEVAVRDPNQEELRIPAGQAGAGRWTKRFTDALKVLTGTKEFSSAFTAAGTPNERIKANAHTLLTDDKYKHLHRAGVALAATGHPAASALGGAAMIAAAVGPEAETVLGPHVQRTAYRYRGTEKTADPQLRKAVAGITPAMVESIQHDPEKLDNLRAQASRGENPARTTVLAHYLNTPGAGGRQMTPQQLTLRLRGDIAAGYLSDKIPDPEDTALSIAAGQLPPSQGVIINSAGNVVSESMGYNGDHFLPFDLKNLTSLHGGQYVRTRAAGGPTSEDIYTGLMSGARQMQVVSNSGVFTVEFDPDLRGGRRYSDKASQMVGRYQAILDAVNGAGLLANDLSPQEQKKIERQAYEDARGNVANARLLADERIDSEREKRKYNVKDHDEIEAEADAAVKEYVQNLPNGSRLSPQDIDHKKREVLDDLYEEQKTTSVRALKLDGEGYFRAMKALKTEFPYYIRSVDFQERPRFLQIRRLNTAGEPLPQRGKGTDQGFVQPGAVAEASNHAVSVSSRRTQGFYDKAKVGTPVHRPTLQEAEDQDATPDKTKRAPASNLMPDPDSPKLTDLLKDKHLAATVGRSESKLAELADQVANEKDNSAIPFKSVKTWSAAAQLNWVNQTEGTGEELISGILNGTVDDDVADLYVNALDRFIKLKGGRIDDFKEQYPEDYAAGMAGARQVQALMAMRKPFSPTGDPAGEAGRNAVTAGKPMSSEKVINAGISQRNFDALFETLTSDVAKQVNAYRQPNADPVDDIDTVYADWDASAKDGSPAEQAMATTEAKKALDIKHQAWTFVHAEKLAADARAFRDGDARPKVPGVDGLTDDPNLNKRYSPSLTILPSSSHLATEFRKFLQSR